MADYSFVCFADALGASAEQDGVAPSEQVSHAIQENPRNGSLTPRGNAVARKLKDEPENLALYTSKLWSAGRQLRIGFINGTAWQRNQVKYFAVEWQSFANIGFNFVDSGPSDILISFNPSLGSWSLIGTDSPFRASKNEASMNLAWIADGQTPDQIRQVVLHEFGHALGAVHEHESPYSSIQWNKDVIYKELMGPPNRWTKAVIDINMFTDYSLDDVQATNFDKDSIMLYQFKASWTTNGQYTQFNSDLSNSDKTYIRFCYPAPQYDAGSFSIVELHPWDKPQDNNSLKKYYYESYSATPQIAIGLNALDIGAQANIRIHAETSQIQTDSFVASLNCWADTFLYGATMSYLEVSQRFDYLQTGSYNTSETRPGDKSQLNNSKRIDFARAFNGPPKVVVFLNALDMDRSRNWRLKTFVSDVDARGFTLHLDSWSDSILYSAGATWLAYPADRAGVASGRFSTDDVREWNPPKADNSGTTGLKPAFRAVIPKVFTGIDKIDYRCGTNLRLRVALAEVTPSNMKWRLQSWADSVMYSSGASYFAWAE